MIVHYPTERPGMGWGVAGFDALKLNVWAGVIFLVVPRDLSGTQLRKQRFWPKMRGTLSTVHD